MKPLAQSRIKALTIALLVTMVLAICCPLNSVAAETEWTAQPMHHVRSPDAAVWSSGYSPDDMRAAYNLPVEGGTGTIAIIDAYDDPYVTRDLTTFSLQFGLPLPNLEVHKMSSLIWPDVNWAVEISLDVQWAHAIAPNAKILLVEARSNYLSDLLAAVNYARNRPDVVAVSMSWGGSEFSTETYYDSWFTSAYGASFFASSGDIGGVVSWPSSSVNVVSVGGTTLTLTGGVASETAWSGSGGGVSAYEPQPGYQTGIGYSKRATPDVSYDADPSTGFAVYDSYGYGGWIVVGGTSAGAPQWAAIQALGRTANNNNFYTIYKSAAYGTDFRDITSGASGRYTAKPGYDLTTGIGSPLTTNFAASPVPDFTMTAAPNPVTINTAATNTGTTTLTVTALSGFTGTVTLTATAPAGWTATPSPTAITGSGASTLTITVPTGTLGGTYPVTVKGTSGSITHSITVNVQVLVTTPDFTMTAAPNPVTINTAATNTGTTTLTVTALSGFTGTVTLTATAPAGWTATPSPTAITGSGASTLTIIVPTGTLGGTYPVTVKGTSGSITHSITVNVQVLVTKPDFALTVFPSSLSIVPGSTKQATVKVTPLNGYTGTVALSASQPTGFIITFSPPSLQSGDSTMTIAVLFYTFTNRYPVTITGKDAAGLTHTTTITVTVTTW
jgi:hypothetical protein